jgi:5-methylcytosine-specific restriction enzyme subunit McrC
VLIGERDIPGKQCLEVRNALRGGQDADAEGMLLYPVIAKRIRLRYEISGHSIRICTIDLAQHWKSIRQELLELVE